MLGCCLWISWVGILGKEANFERLPDFWLGNGRKNPEKRQIWKKYDKLSEEVRLVDPGASGTRPTDVEAGTQVSTYVSLGNGLFVPRNSHLGTMTWKLLVPAPVKVIPVSDLSPCWHVISCFSLFPLNGNAENDLRPPLGIEFFFSSLSSDTCYCFACY